MPKNKKSLFKWLTGTSGNDEYVSFDSLDSDSYLREHTAPAKAAQPTRRGSISQTIPVSSRETSRSQFAQPESLVTVQEHEPEGELSVDMYETPTHIIIKAMIAGVRPEDIDINITRDSVTLRGKREGHTEGGSDNFVFKELYWGAFSRVLSLPQEIDIDGAEASEKHGLLLIRLPKVDKGKQTKVKVKAN